MSATASLPEIAEDKPGTNWKQVTPANRAKINPIVKHYGKMAHPFTACVRDNRKRFGDRAERVCAVVKDLARGTTKWRKGGKAHEEDAEAFYDAAGGDIDALVEMCRVDVTRRLEILIEEIVALAETYTDLGGEPTGLTSLIAYANRVAEAGFTTTAPKPRKAPKQPTSTSSFGSSDRAQARGTGDKGGQFVRAGMIEISCARIGTLRGFGNAVMSGALATRRSSDGNG